MKKVIIVSHSLELGGVEKSLLGMLEAFDKTKYKVDLFLLRHEGELMPYIPEGITLLEEIPAYTVLARPMKDTLLEGHILLTAARLYGKIKAKAYNKNNNYSDSGVGIEYSHKYTYRLMPDISPDSTYDLAISFLTPHYIVANKVSAIKKMAWIHTDYSKVQINVDSELEMWRQFDRIVSVSDKVSDIFIDIFPSLKNKVQVIENILPEQLILSQAGGTDIKGEMPDDGTIKLLSIGRYCTAKNFDNIPDICQKILSMGWNIKWYIIGYGGDEELIRKKIKDHNMDDRVIMLGKKENPYPYISECDYYIQPSRYEGKCVSVREAQLLCKPVIITDYPTSSSQVENGRDGVVVPLENDACAKAIGKVLSDPMAKDSLAGNCRVKDYSNRSEIEKIYKYLESGDALCQHSCSGL